MFVPKKVTFLALACLVTMLTTPVDTTTTTTTTNASSTTTTSMDGTTIMIVPTKEEEEQEEATTSAPARVSDTTGTAGPALGKANGESGPWVNHKTGAATATLSVEHGLGRQQNFVALDRSLTATTSPPFPGDLTQAANSTGNPIHSCGGSTTCVNGCKSLFFKVTGGNGGKVTASTCGAATFFLEYFVWEGNGTCASFKCVAAGDVFGCGVDETSAYISWTAKSGTDYFVQVHGHDGATGTFNLTVTSDAPVCQPVPFTQPPTKVPTNVPTRAPTNAPTKLPTEAPTASPSKAPTAAPDRCAGEGTTYWLYDPTTNAPIRQLVNNSATCLLHPFNVEVRPCGIPVVANPIRVRLLGTTGDTPAVVYKSKRQIKAPFLLFGPSSTIGDVLPSPKPLHNGDYTIATKGAPEWGRLQFTQACPCPDGTNKKPGKKGCMK